MQDYRIFEDPQNHQFIVEGNIVPDSIAVQLPDSPLKNQFVSYFLHKADIETGIDFLNCISLNNHVRANEGLFAAALSMLIKCFQSAESRIAIDENAFKKFAPDMADGFDKYKAWRNKHFIHDVNGMTETTAFLLVAPESHSETFGGSPSVVWIKVPVNYIVEGRTLYEIMQSVWKYCVFKIDQLGDKIAEQYKDKTRDELLSLERANLKLATLENPTQKRGVQENGQAENGNP